MHDLHHLAAHTKWAEFEDHETFGITANDAIIDDEALWKAFQTRYHISTGLGYIRLVLEARE